MSGLDIASKILEDLISSITQCNKYTLRQHETILQACSFAMYTVHSKKNGIPPEIRFFAFWNFFSEILMYTVHTDFTEIPYVQCT